MACIKWSQPILTSFRWDTIPIGHLSQRSLSRNPRIDPIFSPLPNYTLWIPWPVAYLPRIGWVQVGGAPALCACSTPSEFFFFLAFTPFLLPFHLFDSAVYTSWCLSLWHEGCVGFWAHIFYLSSFLGLGIAWAKAFIVQLSPCFFFYGRGPFGH